MSKIFIYFNVFLYYSYSYLYFFEIGKLPIKPLYWFLFTISIGFVFVFFNHGFKVPSKRIRNLLLWAIIFITLSTASAVFVSGGSSNALQQLIFYCEGASLLVVFSLLLQDDESAKHAMYALLAVVIAITIINIVDFFAIGGYKMSVVSGRAAGMYGNPNVSGKFSVLGMAVTVFILPKKLRFMYCMFVLMGVILTFSRAAIMLWALTVSILTWYRVFVLSRAASFSIMAVFIGMLGVLLVAGAWLNIFDTLGMTDYLDENTQSRISGSFIDQNDYSSHGRMLVAKKGIKIFLNSPVVGRGIGSGTDFTDGLRAHNSYIQIAAEQGLVGLVIFFGLLWLLWTNKTAMSRVFVVGFAGFSVFTHNMLDQPAMYVLVAIVVSSYLSDSEKLKNKSVDEFKSSNLTDNTTEDKSSSDVLYLRKK